MNMPKTLWKFFASVKLAIVTLSALAISSIAGTIILQNQPQNYYLARYGENVAEIFFLLDIPNMYTSWWFLALLGVLSVNLVVCSIHRFPFAWKQITKDQTKYSPKRLKDMAFSHSLHKKSRINKERVNQILSSKGFKVEHCELSEGHLIAAQQGAWSRCGVYIVHLSILVIFAGAMVGQFLGFKGFMLLPESEATTMVRNTQSSGIINLDFEVQCDFFDIEFYQNGMPKEYLSGLSILENGKKVLSQKIEVNTPLKYQGITFYQASYQPLPNTFTVTIADPKETAAHSFIVPFQQKESWPEKNITFGVLNTEKQFNKIRRIKVWIKAGKDKAKIVTVIPGKEFQLNKKSDIIFTVDQAYATGLQVAKDPGVWLVYLGCLLMLFGLYLSFFVSHRRLWLVLFNDKKQAPLFAGTTTKNKMGFEKIFTAIYQELEKSGATRKN